MGNKGSRMEEGTEEMRHREGVRYSVRMKAEGGGRWGRGEGRRRSEEFELTEDEDDTEMVEDVGFLKVFQEEMTFPSSVVNESSGHSMTTTSSEIHSESKLMEIEEDDDSDTWSKSATLCSSVDDCDLEDEEVEKEEDLMEQDELYGNNNAASLGEGEEYCDSECVTPPDSPPPESETETEGSCNGSENEEEEKSKGDVERLKEQFPGLYDSVLVSLLDSGYPMALVDHQGTREKIMFEMAGDGQVNAEIEGDSFTPHVEDGKLLIPIFKFQGGAYLYHVEESHSLTMKTSEGVKTCTTSNESSESSVRDMVS